MGEPIFQVDAFTDKKFSGNPAGVCILDEARPDSWMQAVAAEMNVSETAFVRREQGGFHLRWFTPAVEVDLCGHATLAAAHALWESGLLQEDEPARFRTLSGPLTAARRGGMIAMDFPAEPERPAVAPDALRRALGAEPLYFGKNRMDCLAEVESEAVLRGLSPDFELLKSIPARGFIVTAASDAPEFDFVSRFFAPAVGVNEDPVTGSAHCCLGPYWSRHSGKTEFTAYQASARGGVVRVALAGDRVIISGQAVTVLQGELV